MKGPAILRLFCMGSALSCRQSYKASLIVIGCPLYLSKRYAKHSWMPKALMHPNHCAHAFIGLPKNLWKKFTEYCQIPEVKLWVIFPKAIFTALSNNHKKHLCDRWEEHIQRRIRDLRRIPWKEIDPKTMQSRLCKVYFRRGSFDSDGITGI